VDKCIWVHRRGTVTDQVIVSGKL